MTESTTIQQYKRCTICNEDKTTDNFYRDKRCNSYATYCRKCDAKRPRKYSYIKKEKKLPSGFNEITDEQKKIIIEYTKMNIALTSIAKITGIQYSRLFSWKSKGLLETLVIYESTL